MSEPTSGGTAPRILYDGNRLSVIAASLRDGLPVLYAAATRLGVAQRELQRSPATGVLYYRVGYRPNVKVNCKKRDVAKWGLVGAKPAGPFPMNSWPNRNARRRGQEDRGRGRAGRPRRVCGA